MFNDNVCGVDLGTSTVKLYSQRNSHILTEKTMVAIRNRTQVIAVGNDERTGVDGRLARVGAERVRERHDAAARRAAVDYDVRRAREARRHVGFDPVSGIDRHRRRRETGGNSDHAN